MLHAPVLLSASPEAARYFWWEKAPETAHFQQALQPADELETAQRPKPLVTDFVFDLWAEVLACMGLILNA